MANAEETRNAFRPRLGALGGLIGLAAGYLWGMEWLDAGVGAGVGFIVGGAAPLLREVWRYLAVFFAATGGFVWLLVHYLK